MYRVALPPPTHLLFPCHHVAVCSRPMQTWQKAPLGGRRVPYNHGCKTGKVQSIPKPVKEVKAT